MILSMTNIMPWIGVLVQEKIKTGSNDLSSYKLNTIYHEINSEAEAYSTKRKDFERAKNREKTKVEREKKW